ncbi:hypothetical protein BJ508DRAFT_381760 [Ascobolus immersus RN42]|uniref:Uncharacterized protein n=1 Tax=Ascobolus immersus RN42 TaxID=1160509 RepID=A0A3N4HQX1_ASCIM|nr:hypothetical protein BJ508DRAFT_381760 [Ascobolus immersus RN42]
MRHRLQTTNKHDRSLSNAVSALQLAFGEQASCLGSRSNHTNVSVYLTIQPASIPPMPIPYNMVCDDHDSHTGEADFVYIANEKPCEYSVQTRYRETPTVGTVCFISEYWRAGLDDRSSFALVTSISGNLCGWLLTGEEEDDELWAEISKLLKNHVLKGTIASVEKGEGEHEWKGRVVWEARTCKQEGFDKEMDDLMISPAQFMNLEFN